MDLTTGGVVAVPTCAIITAALMVASSFFRDFLWQEVQGAVMDLWEGAEVAPAVETAHLARRLEPVERAVRRQAAEPALSTTGATGTTVCRGRGGRATPVAREAEEAGSGAERDGTQLVVAALWSADQVQLMKTSGATQGAAVMAG